MKGKLIGRGRMSEVYAWGDDQVLKLFYEGHSSAYVENEAILSRIAHEAKIATPSIGDDVIEVDGRYGILIERIHGSSILADMSARPWTLIGAAHTLAEQHALMHQEVVPDLPAQHEQLEQLILSAQALSTTQKDAAINAMQQLPTGDRLCHGDFHPDNIIMSTRGAVTIDWATASQGNPLADVARTSLMLQLGELPPDSSLITRLVTVVGRNIFHKMYLKRYFELQPDDQQELSNWKLPILAARLGYGIPEEQEQLLVLFTQS